MYDVYGGTGFIGGCYCALYPNTYIVPREDIKPNNKDIIYFFRKFGILINWGLTLFSPL